MNQQYDEICTVYGRPVAGESDSGERVELRTHSETVLLSDADALALAAELGRVANGH